MKELTFCLVVVLEMKESHLTERLSLSLVSSYSASSSSTQVFEIMESEQEVGDIINSPKWFTGDLINLKEEPSTHKIADKAIQCDLLSDVSSVKEEKDEVEEEEEERRRG
ncbi:hypothetical protein LSTR_LSTR002590 [Laodelphax striatellus]|uniref:Uncharacterized protein n=1 Tax=Laodelphax striatellus TaxID=195883 RepID=A0A482XLZ1_LAOST|nr:hypothetical protein LSTR_LSTR002590 [Laodelphax striatellus]